MDKKIKDDMDILKFGRLISMITIDTPISIEFDNNYGQKKDRWWTSQREHLTVWCLHQPTQGRAYMTYREFVRERLKEELRTLNDGTVSDIEFQQLAERYSTHPDYARIT